MDTLGKRLKAAREAFKPKKLTQKQVAGRAKISQATVADIERGRNKDSRYSPRLAYAVSCSLRWLATGQGEMQGGDVPSRPDNEIGNQPGLGLTEEQEQALALIESLDKEALDALMKLGQILSTRPPPRREMTAAQDMGEIEHTDSAVSSDPETWDESKKDFEKRNVKWPKK